MCAQSNSFSKHKINIYNSERIVYSRQTEENLLQNICYYASNMYSVHVYSYLYVHSKPDRVHTCMKMSTGCSRLHCRHRESVASIIIQVLNSPVDGMKKLKVGHIYHAVMVCKCFCVCVCAFLFVDEWGDRM